MSAKVVINVLNPALIRIALNPLNAVPEHTHSLCESCNVLDTINPPSSISILVRNRVKPFHLHIT